MLGSTNWLGNQAFNLVNASSSLVPSTQILEVSFNWSERLPVKQMVAGSSPVPPAIMYRIPVMHADMLGSRLIISQRFESSLYIINEYVKQIGCAT